MEEISIFWHRRDLRIIDNAGLYHALKNENNVQPLFIFDKEILSKLPNKYDRRVEFIQHCMEDIQQELNGMGVNLWVKYGKPLEIFKEIARLFKIKAVYVNHDYESYALQRDSEVADFLSQNGTPFYTYKDQCIFEKNEVVKDDGNPYTIFTPYMRKWKTILRPFFLKAYTNDLYFNKFRKSNPERILSLEEIGFKRTNTIFPSNRLNSDLLKKYKELRDFPSLDATSKISIHLRFGTVSIREMTSRASELNENWLNELIWRDFYMMILYHFPHVEKSAFKPAYDRIIWRNNTEEFERWCNGHTGYPIVDAGMRELNETGFMHNRVRMIVASFLTKHLLIDWRWGEAYFAEKLNDFELSSNNGGWQWAAGSGCDAAPYFRVFNPYEQTKKFDHDYKYISKWVPEYKSTKYPKPIVEHTFARKRVLETYKKYLNVSETVQNTNEKMPELFS